MVLLLIPEADGDDLELRTHSLDERRNQQKGGMILAERSFSEWFSSECATVNLAENCHVSCYKLRKYFTNRASHSSELISDSLQVSPIGPRVPASD